MSRRARTVDELTNEARDGIVKALAEPLPAGWRAGPATATGNGRRPDPFGYTIGYAVLRDLLDRTDLADPLHVRAALYAAYGWMPKVLNADVPDELISEVGRIALHARSLVSSDGKAVDDARLAGLLDRIRTSGAVAATNNAPVGLSKFLHLAAPRVVPIWDSRICVNLGWKKHNDGSLRHFKAYVRRFTGGVMKGVRSPRTIQRTLLKRTKTTPTDGSGRPNGTCSASARRRGNQGRARERATPLTFPQFNPKRRSRSCRAKVHRPSRY